MGTVFFNQSAASPPSVSQSLNGLSLDYLSQNSSSNFDHPIYSILFTAIWVVLLVTIIFGGTGNILVLYVYTNRNDSKTCTFFIKMLAIVDLTICLIVAPLELYQITTGRESRSKPFAVSGAETRKDNSVDVSEEVHLSIISFFVFRQKQTALG